MRVSKQERAHAKRRVDDALAVERTAAPTPNDFSEPAAVPEPELARGTRVGEYEIDAPVGRGGFGTVYRATQPVIGKQVAIKVLSRRYSADQDIVSRFAAEARAVNQIRHRNIIDIFSFGQLADGRHYYVMEYLDGTPLDGYLAERGPLALDEALPILRAVARALDAAHGKGIAHRDLKPENIMLVEDDDGAVFPVLLDFGIAKLMDPEDTRAHKTGTGVPLGTPYYMSPEQCRGRDVDHRTDIYSFGVMTYRLLSGVYPFDGAMIDILHDQVYADPEPPSTKNPALSREVDAAIAWMMQKEPASRPPTVLAAVHALAGDRAATPAVASSQLVGRPAAEPAAARPTRGRWWWAVAAFVLAGGATAAIVAWQRGDGETASTRDPSATAASAVTPPASSVERDTAAGTNAGSAHTRAAAAAATEPTVAAAALRADSLVTLELSGVPDGAEVSVAGKVIGTAPLVQVPKGSSKLVLTLTVDGYLPASRPVVPDRDQRVAIPLRKKASARPTHGDDHEDVIHVFDKGGNP